MSTPQDEPGKVALLEPGTVEHDAVASAIDITPPEVLSALADVSDEEFLSAGGVNQVMGNAVLQVWNGPMGIARSLKKLHDDNTKVDPRISLAAIKVADTIISRMTQKEEDVDANMTKEEAAKQKLIELQKVVTQNPELIRDLLSAPVSSTSNIPTDPARQS